MDSGRSLVLPSDAPPSATSRPASSRVRAPLRATTSGASAAARGSRARPRPDASSRPTTHGNKAVSRLAAELHDRIAQLLWSTDVDIALALDSLPPDSEEAREHLLSSRRTIDVAYRDVRLCIGALRANLPFQRDVLDALESCLSDFRSRTGVATIFAPTCPSPEWSRFVQLNVLAIVQQGLDNVARHAQATRVVVDLERLPAGWSLTLRDDGRGFLPSSLHSGHDPVGHYGLAIMRERAESFGGSFAIHSAKGEGTALTICVPESARLRS